MTRKKIVEFAQPVRRVYIDPRPAFRLPGDDRWQLLDGDTPYREIEEVASGVARMLGFGTVWVRGEGSLSEMPV